MKERPILFNGEMVRAILDGRKTQTRRVVKNSNGDYNAHGIQTLFRCPLGQPGDRLWVRETWQVAKESLDYETGCEYDLFPWDAELYGNPEEHLHGNPRGGTKAALFYKADGEERNPGNFYDAIGVNGKTLLKKEINWRPSIHMPRWASRITLEITGVRVERLQDISAEDAKAEGVQPPNLPPEISGVAGDYVADERTSFAILWNRINGAGSWAKNPWVWVVEFKRVETAEQEQAE